MYLYIFLAFIIALFGKSFTDEFENLPAECGKTKYDDENGTTSERIIGGVQDKLGATPWIVRLGYKNAIGDIEFFCGGTLISQYYVVSAAHCEERANVIRVGEYNSATDVDCLEPGKSCAPPHQDMAVARVISADFCRVSFKNDIDLIELQEAVKFNDYVKPICLPKKQIDFGHYRSKAAKVAGWGRTVSHSPMSVPSNLLYVESPVLEPEACNVITRTGITDGQLCLGTRGLELSNGSCYGDSGGPATIVMDLGEGERSYLVGVVSHGYSLCEYGPAVYTDVSTYSSWIAKQITKK